RGGARLRQAHRGGRGRRAGRGVRREQRHRSRGVGNTVSAQEEIRGSGMEVAVVSGLSGAGRSTAAKCLEDLGWFVVDNLPPSLVATMVDLASRSQGSVDKIAVVVDVRSRGFTSDVREVLAELDEKGLRPRVVFLEAADDALVRRFDSVRRPHPLQEDGTLVDGIARERELLRDLRGEADLVVDTSVLNVHELRAKITAAFA